jgi:hypothetical protein
MLVCLSFVSSAQVNDYGDENNDGVLQQPKLQGRGMSACVINFSGCIHTLLIAKFLGDIGRHRDRTRSRRLRHGLQRHTA